MDKKWKIAIIILFLLIAWIRISPIIPWRQERLDWEERMREQGWVQPTEECWIGYNWSWWSLRFTSVSLECEEK